jgi:nucleolar protein 56
LISLATEIVNLTDLRSELSDRLEDTMKSIAPNLTSLLGSLLAARLLARTGNLRKLASLTSGAIQVLGAEKALFRAMRSGGKPPKHGIIFQHHAIRTAVRWQRGRMARFLAGRIALAARIDAYRGELEPSILIDLQKKIELLKARASDRKSPPDGVLRKRFKHGER